MQQDPHNAELDRHHLGEYLADPGGPVGKKAASALFGRYQSRVYALCYRFMRDEERALDMAQDALYQAFRSLPELSKQSRFSSWLFAIARNRCFSEIRRADLRRECTIDPDELSGTESDPAAVFEDRMDEGQLIDLIRQNLSPHEQEVLHLRCFEKLSVDRITQIMKIEEGSGARAVLQRARRKLRAAMEALEKESGLHG